MNAQRTTALRIQPGEQRLREAVPEADPTLGAVITALLRLGCSMRASEVAQYSGLALDDVEVALRVLEADGVVEAVYWRAKI